MVETIQWTDAGVVMIDQTRLPREQKFVTCRAVVGGLLFLVFVAVASDKS